MGMHQSLKIPSLQALDEHEDDLKQLRIEDMKASRPEDIDEILGKIPDHGAFNACLQTLLFQDILPSWRSIDVACQLDRVGHMIRYHKVLSEQDVGRNSNRSP